MKNIPVLILLFCTAFSYKIHSQNINKPNIPFVEGLQVNSYSGALFYERSDLYIPGHGPSIDITFYYNSANTAIDFGFGKGWSMSYSMDVQMEGANCIVRREDGRKDIYTLNGNSYTPPVGIHDSLTEYQSGLFRLRTKRGMQYFFNDSTHHRVTSIVDANGNTLSLTYTNYLLSTITDASGRSVSLTYNNGHLIQIADPNTSPARNILFSNDSSGNPITVTNALGYSMQYEYDVVHNMTKVIDEAGTAYNITYLNCATVLTLSSPLNSRSFNFNTTLLTTTDSMYVNGSVQSNSYRYDTLGNIVEFIQHNNANSASKLYEYDTMKNMTKMTDPNGHEYDYQYDARGNRIQEINPLGGTTILNYEVGYNRISYHKDPNNNIIQYMYDANGNKIQASKPMSVTENYAYDVYGNMTTKVDGEGYSSHFSYNNTGDLTRDSFSFSTVMLRTFDNVGHVLTTTDPNGHTTTNVYDKLNRKTQTTDALGHITLYAYDSRSNLISVTDPLGHITIYQYDALNRKTQMTTPAGTSTFTYDEQGNLKTHTDNKGNVTQYVYDKRNRLISQTNAMGAIRTMGYDKNNNKTDEYDFNGNHMLYQYDSLNRLTKETNALGQITEYVYDANGNRTSIKDANYYTTTFVYDGLNRMTELHKPIGTIYYEYDKNNKNTKIIDANNHATTYVYDSLNRLKTVTDALAHSSQYGYDANGNLISATDRNGNLATYQFDFLNRKIKTTYAIDEKDSMAYNGVGKLIYQKTKNNATILYAYDGVHRLLSLTDSFGTIESYRYDLNSNLTSVKNANGDSTRYTYDALNRVKSTINPSGNSMTNSYDANSNLISVQDRNGNTTTHVYDANNRKISSTSALGLLTTMGYDAVGNLTTLTDAASHTTTYNYDANDRLSSEWLADGTSTTYSYDAVGNMLTRTDNNGAITQYAYNVLNWLTLRNYPGTNDDAFTYDNEGNVLSANNSNATISCTYDNTNRKLSETLNGKTVSYNYNVPGGRKTITYPGGRVIQNNYDARRRLSSITELFGALGSNLAIYNYDGALNLLTNTLINGVVSHYSYNDNDWVTSLSHKQLTDTIAAFNYSFDNNGNTLAAEKRHRLNNSEKYNYDIDERLTNYKEGALSAGNIASPLTETQYNFDGVGNRTSTTKSTSTPSNASNYVFTTSTGATIDPMTGASQILNPNNDNTPSPVMNIGFTFMYEGVAYNTFSMSPDGFIKLGALAIPEPTNNMASLTNRPKLMAMWDDLATGTNGSGKMLLTGISGSRILKLQWFVPIPKNIVGAPNSRIQMWLYEGTNVIEFRYSTGNNPTGAATVGINSATPSATIFQSVTTSSHTSSNSVPNNANNLWPGNQRLYRFTPGGPISVSLTTNYSTDNVNKYTLINTTLPTYNANGNTLFDGAHMYQFDFENRLTGVDLLTLNASSYAHDAFGRRIQKTTSAGTNHYLYDGNGVIEERDNANAVLATYVNDPMDDNENRTGCGVLSMQRGGINYYYHTNYQGSVTAITDNTGAVAERYEYDAFGYPTIYDSSFVLRTSTAIGNNYLFTGKEFDKETGNYHVIGEPLVVHGPFDGDASNTKVSFSITGPLDGNYSNTSASRSYNPNWGRFAQRGYSSGINRYTYSMNNPTNTNQSTNYINYSIPSLNGVRESQMVNIYSYNDGNGESAMESISMSFGNGGIHNMKNSYFVTRLMEEEGMYYSIDSWVSDLLDLDKCRELLLKWLYPEGQKLPPRPTLPPPEETEPAPLPPVELEDIKFNVSGAASGIQYNQHAEPRVPLGPGGGFSESLNQHAEWLYQEALKRFNKKMIKFWYDYHQWMARRFIGPSPMPPKPPSPPQVIR